METVLENGPPIGRYTFSSDLICQRMPPVPAFPPHASTKHSSEVPLCLNIQNVIKGPKTKAFINIVL